MKYVLWVVLAAATLSAADKKTYTGTVTDTMCGNGSHGVMRMGPTDADCARACVSVHAAKFVFYDGTDAYRIADQKGLEKIAGQKVKVVGTQDAKSKTMTIEEVAPAKASAVPQPP